MVRLEFSGVVLDNTNEHIYIPVWCDWNHKVFKYFISIFKNLHSSMVRLEYVAYFI